MSVADEIRGNISKLREMRAFYFDIYTRPGSIYAPMNVHIVMPFNIQIIQLVAGEICRAEVVYTGIYSVCAQANILNKNKLKYLRELVEKFFYLFCFCPLFP